MMFWCKAEHERAAPAAGGGPPPPHPGEAAPNSSTTRPPHVFCRTPCQATKPQPSARAQVEHGINDFLLLLHTPTTAW